MSGVFLVITPNKNVHIIIQDTLAQKKDMIFLLSGYPTIPQIVRMHIYIYTHIVLT